MLVVDDTAEVAAFACGLLKETGYTTQQAGSAAEALAMLAWGEPVDVVFSDVVMPRGMDGVELAMALRSSYPYIAVVLATGYSGRLTHDSVLEGVETLRKPYHSYELAAALERALAARRAAPEDA